jgi:hypothetical protein
MGHDLFGGGSIHEYYAGFALLYNPSLNLGKKRISTLRIMHCAAIERQ